MSNTETTPKPKTPSQEIAVERNLTELEIIDDILTNKLSATKTNSLSTARTASNPC